MNLTYNSNIDAFYVLFADVPAAKQEDVGRGVVLHFDEAGGIVQIELRNARQRLSGDVALPGPPPAG
jgi:uncharacterized protein YuzE